MSVANAEGAPGGCGWPDYHCHFCWGIEEATCEECDALVIAAIPPPGIAPNAHEPWCVYRGGPAVHYEDVIDGVGVAPRWDYTWDEPWPPPPVARELLSSVPLVPLPDLDEWLRRRATA